MMEKHNLKGSVPLHMVARGDEPVRYLPHYFRDDRRDDTRGRIAPINFRRIRDMIHAKICENGESASTKERKETLESIGALRANQLFNSTPARLVSAKDRKRKRAEYEQSIANNN